jgi:ribosome biogenesis GTPase
VTPDVTLSALGWDAGWVETFAPHAALGLRPARVVAVHRDTSIVRDSSGDRPAAVSGVFRFEALATVDFPVVGDWVALDEGGAIAAILARRTAFRRMATDATRRGTGLDDEQVMAANVDVALLVAGLDHDFNVRRIERYLAVAWSSGVIPVVVLNKSDLADDVDDRLLAVAEIAPGVATVAMSAATGDGLEALWAHLPAGTTAAILGSSGVGKSTILNALLGEDRQRTGAVRESDSRGRHTTTHRELFQVRTGAMVIDTPGIRALEVLGADDGLDATFDDVVELAATCRFSDCSHNGEPGCAIRVALADGRLSEERLAGHQKLERELAHVARQSDPRARAEYRRKWRLLRKAGDAQAARKYGSEQ